MNNLADATNSALEGYDGIVFEEILSDTDEYLEYIDERQIEQHQIQSPEDAEDTNVYGNLGCNKQEVLLYIEPIVVEPSIQIERKVR